MGDISSFLAALTNNEGSHGSNSKIYLKPRHLIRFLVGVFGDDRLSLSQQLATVAENGYLEAKTTVSVLDNAWSPHELVEFASHMCSSAESKGAAAALLKAMEEQLSLSPDEAALLVKETVELDFFRDLTGTAQDLFDKFPELESFTGMRESLEQFEDDSDADEDGNLRGFIVDSCDEEEGTPHIINESDEHEMQQKKKAKKKAK